MRKDILWGYLAQFLQYGAALLILPLLLRKLSSAELGVWYVFMTISALVTMLDMGFTATLTRNVSYVMGGARKLLKDGHELVDRSSDIDYGLLKAILAASRHIFLCIALSALLLLATLGTWYILHITHGQIDRLTVLLAWAIFVLATTINLYYKYFTPLLQGRGLFAAFYKSSAIANIGFVAITAILLSQGAGLTGVAFGFLVSALIGRWLSWHFFYDASFRQHITTAKQASLHTNEILAVLWHNAWRLGLGMIGAFLILRANTLLASAYLGLATTASYALTLQVISVIQSISNVTFNIQQQKLAKLRVSNAHQQIIATVETSLASSLGLFLLGATLLIFAGNPLIKMIGGHTELLTTPLLTFISLTAFLELNHSLAASIIVTGNRVPYVKPALFSGLAVFLLSLVGLKYAELGVAWLITAQFLVQLAYNNWRWPLLMAQEMQINYCKCLANGLLKSFSFPPRQRNH